MEEKESLWLRIRSSEWCYNFERRYIDSWYYPIKDFLFPWRTLRIRNLPRSYTEPSERVFHAVFTLLCCHIDGNEGGRAKFVERIAYHAEQMHDHSHLKAWHDAYVEMLAAYDFYNRIDWDNPGGYDWNNAHCTCGLGVIRCRCNHDERMAAVEKGDAIREEGNRILASVIKTHGFWWS